MIPTETLRALEFDKILKTVADFTNSDTSRKATLELGPLYEITAIKRRLGQVDEICRLVRKNIHLRLAPFEDIRDALERIRPEGAILDTFELLALMPPLQIMTILGKQLANRTNMPLMLALSGGLTGFPDLLTALERSIDQEGGILDTASKLLLGIRGRKRVLTAKVRKRLEEIIRERQTTIFLQDEFMTQRGGRWVIPVRMDAKGMVPGVVHDVSKSGETAFIEPLEIIGLANELENLLANEKVEEIRILRQISHWIREDAAAIEEQFETIVQIDVLNSIARFAELIQAKIPIISHLGKLCISGGRHPLLMLHGKEVVPLDLELGAETVNNSSHTPNRVMVITGPNAGGKTIAIKTAGLMLLMALTGMPVSAKASSEFPFATRLLVDIGDEQSIKSSLSTFSAHVSRIAGILREADSGSVVILDELGTGTEPGQGAAIACAVLRDLHEKGVLVFATTHLTEIMGFVRQTPGMVNAAMEFDRRALLPLYRLKIGEPGQSHALEVARRYGLPDSVITFAKELAGRLETDFNALLAEVEERRINYEELLVSIRRREDKLAVRERLDVRNLDEAKERQRKILENAYRDARELAQNARREINALLEEARRGKTREAKRQLSIIEEIVDEKIRKIHPETILAPEKIKTGGSAFIRSIGYDGTILSVDVQHGRLRVRTGQIELDVPMSDACPPQGKMPKSREPRRSTLEVEELDSIKLVGLWIDPALSRLETFLNHAVLGGLSEARIIHGRGTGTLMRAVREHLSNHPLVSSFRGGEQFEGGEGVTVVILQ